MNLIEGTLQEMNRVRELIKLYEEIPGNVGMIAARLMQIDIQEAEKAIGEGDVLKLIVAYAALKGCKE